MTEQHFEPITPEQLRERAAAFQQQKFRLVQIGAARLDDDIELTYSFDLDYQLANLRLRLPAAGARIPSISGTYWCAFLYENEIHDLFNVTFDGLAVDFGGNLYQTRVKFPFEKPTASAAKPAPTPFSAPIVSPKPALVH